MRPITDILKSGMIDFEINLTSGNHVMVQMTKGPHKARMSVNPNSRDMRAMKNNIATAKRAVRELSLT
jgi:hypothetical protein